MNLIQLLQHEKMSIKLAVDASKFFQQSKKEENLLNGNRFLFYCVVQ